MVQIGAQQGWQCPLCKRIYGPFVKECYNCNNRESEIKVTGENGLKIDWEKGFSITQMPTIY